MAALISPFLSLSLGLAIGLGLGPGDHVQIPDTGAMGDTQHLLATCLSLDTLSGTLPPSPAPLRAKGRG